MRKQITPKTIRKRKGDKERISLVTAYDYPMARWANASEIDIIFVSDALATVGLGRENTLSVTVDEIIYHTRAVKSGSGQCLVLASMPFMSHSTPEEAVHNATRLIKEGGAHAVEIEGSRETAKTIRAIAKAGIPVIGHVGLTKYIASSTGHYINQGKTTKSAIDIIDDALAFEKAGAFAIVVECVPEKIAGILTDCVDVPTIGFGAGRECDGQALVSQDMLGMFDKFCPKFVKRFADFTSTATGAFSAFKWDVEKGAFPGEEHVVPVEDAVADEVGAHFAEKRNKKNKKDTSPVNSKNKKRKKQKNARILRAV